LVGRHDDEDTVAVDEDEVVRATISIVDFGRRCARQADLALTVQGNFRASSGTIDPELHRRFVEHTPLVQLWPYARGYLAGMGAMLGVTLPPLPLIHALSPLGGPDEPKDADAARPG
jgi:hypothetical protein